MSTCPNTVSQLRRAYFAQAGEVAIRYGVTFERVLDHLRDACTHHRRLPMLEIRHLDDLVHVVACVDCFDLAWRDLAEHHEPALVRAGRQWLLPTDAIVWVRRFLAELHHGDLAGVRSLRSFDGTSSLRKWLGDRLVGALNRSGSVILGTRRPARAWLVEGRAVEGTATDRDDWGPAQLG